MQKYFLWIKPSKIMNHTYGFYTENHEWEFVDIEMENTYEEAVEGNIPILEDLVDGYEECVRHETDYRNLKVTGYDSDDEIVVTIEMKIEINHEYKLYHEMSDGENLSWCIPYLNENGDAIIISNEKVIACYGQYESLLGEKANSEAVHTAMDFLKECGCAECPDRNECDAMDIIE